MSVSWRRHDRARSHAGRRARCIAIALIEVLVATAVPVVGNASAAPERAAEPAGVVGPSREITLDSITGPEVRFHERSEIPATNIGLYEIGTVYDNELTCLAPAVAAGERGACYIPMTVSESGKRLQFDGTLHGTWDQNGFPVAMSQAVRIDLQQILAMPD